MSVRDPRVSIILINWNSFEVTRDCIASLRKMDYRNFEVVLVDNGSVDSSAERLAESDPEIRTIFHGANLGFSGGNNVGIREAMALGAHYLLLLNHSPLLDPYLLT